MLTSSRRGILYPNTTRVDSADVPRDIAALVAALEVDVTYIQGTLAARPTSTAGSPGMQGRIYVASDQTPKQFFWDNGTGWDNLGTIAAGSVGTTELADNAVTNAKMADNSVGTAELIADSITGAKIAAGHGGADDYGTVLPTTGLFNGYRFIFITSSRSFICIYRADIDGTYPWQVVGTHLYTSGSLSGIWLNWAAMSGTLTAPRAGVYQAESAAQGGGASQGAAAMRLNMGGTIFEDHAPNNSSNGGCTFGEATLTLGAVVQAEGNNSNVVSYSYTHQTRLMPVRIS